MKKTGIILSIILIFLMGIITAWTPTENIEMRDYYNISDVPYYNGTDINISGNYYGNASQLTGINSSGENNIITDSLYNSSELEEQADGNLGVINSWLNSLFYSKSNPFNFYNSTTIPDYILSSEESNLNVNNSDLLDGEHGSYYLDNCSADGDCENIGYLDYSNVGSFNVTTGNDICIEGDKCLSEAGSGGGDITAVLTDLTPYLLNGSNSGEIDLNFNETHLNNTIDDRDTNTEYAASGTLLDLASTTFSLNEGTLTTDKWCKFDGDDLVCDVEPVIDTDTTYTAGSNLSLDGTEFNWDSSWVTNNFIDQSNEGSLNVHSSDYWDDLNTESDLTPSNFLSAGDYISYDGNTLDVADNWYDSVGDIPTDTPSNGDTTHLSTADQIYDWATGLFLQNVVEDTTPELGGNLDVSSNNMTSVDCIKFDSGGEICSS